MFMAYDTIGPCRRTHSPHCARFTVCKRSCNTRTRAAAPHAPYEFSDLDIAFTLGISARALAVREAQCAPSDLAMPFGVPRRPCAKFQAARIQLRRNPLSATPNVAGNTHRPNRGSSLLKALAAAADFALPCALPAAAQEWFLPAGHGAHLKVPD